MDYCFLTCFGNHAVDVGDGDATWDSVAYLKSAKHTDLACNDDAGTPCGVNSATASFIAGATPNGASLWWAGIGGYAATDCGSFTLTVTLH